MLEGTFPSLLCLLDKTCISIVDSCTYMLTGDPLQAGMVSSMCWKERESLVSANILKIHINIVGSCSPNLCYRCLRIIHTTSQ